MRVVLAPEGTRGDVYPLLDLGTRLVAHGHEVVVCAPPDFASAALPRGFEFVAVGCPVRAFIREHSGAITHGGVRALRAALAWMGSTLEDQFATLPAATAGADLIVGAGIQLAGASVAERLGIPYRYVVYCPVLLPSREHGPPMLPMGHMPRPLAALAWWSNLLLVKALARRPLNRARARLGLPATHDPFRHWLGRRPLVAVERLLAPVPGDCPYPTQQVGCLHRPDPTPLPPKLDAFLDAGPAPVYVGFGSMGDSDPKRTTHVILDAIETLGCRAVLGRGWAELGGVPLPENVFVADTCSHSRLFARCSVIVHHGGAGTTTTAARAGRPQLVVPHVADQFYWGERVRRLGLGPPPIGRRRLAAPRLSATLAATFDNDVVCERARELGERLAHEGSPDTDPITTLLS